MADFLIDHKVTGRLFNTYEGGSYLMWCLWPQEQVFIDGSALNETVCYDYIHMAFNADYQGGKTTDQLLDRYGVSVILMNGFDFKGHVFWLPAALTEPSQKVWKLVYHDAKSLIYMREPRRGAGPSATRCAEHTRRAVQLQGRQWPAHIVARSPWGKCSHAIGDWTKARQWLSNYLATDRQDVKSRRLLEQLNAAGK